MHRRQHSLTPAALVAACLYSATATGSSRDAAAGAAAPETLQPGARLTHAQIAECSGIVRLDGAWFVHNDSGDAPVIYRSATLDFAQPEILPLAGTQAIDWEDIAVLEGDLLVGDIGDNHGQRDHVTLYRARYHPAEGERAARLELVAVYPCRYPDGRHNAEALAVIDGAVHVITKARKGETTGLYRFDALTDSAALRAGEFNVPRLRAILELGKKEKVTAADFDAATGTLALLTYNRIVGYGRERLAGPPAWSRAIVAGQCEALCFDGDRLIIANEERDVFVVEPIRTPR